MRRLLAFALVAAGCSQEVIDDIAPPDDAAVDMTATVDLATDGAVVQTRPYTLHVPAGYDKDKPTPLVILLHGYTASGALQEAYFKLTAVSDAHTFLYATPDGLKDGGGARYWNATDACCDFYDAKPDDVGYINAIIDDVVQKYNVDARRVFLVGHSNGGFMSYRLACELSPRIAAIVSLAGMMWKDTNKCPAADRVSVLHVHGTSDATVPYAGGMLVPPNGPAIPSARESALFWATRNGCASMTDTSAPPLDLDANLAGSETTIERWTGCAAGTGVELWSMQMGSHAPPGLRTDPQQMPNWGESIYGFLSAHPKQ